MLRQSRKIAAASGPTPGPKGKSRMNVRIIEGARWVDLSRHRDVRGLLTVFDPDDLPFPLARYFIIEAGPAQIRAEHASSAHELFATIRGRVACDLDNGEERQSVVLAAGERGVWVEPGVWVRLHSFAEGTILGVAASLRYAETSQWPIPNRAAFRSGS